MGMAVGTAIKVPPIPPMRAKGAKAAEAAKAKMPAMKVRLEGGTVWFEGEVLSFPKSGPS